MALKIRTLSLKKNLDVLIKQIAYIVIIDISSIGFNYDP